MARLKSEYHFDHITYYVKGQHGGQVFYNTSRAVQGSVGRFTCSLNKFKWMLEMAELISGSK